MIQTEVPLSKCLNCNKDLGAVTGEGDNKPKPGDYTICFYCGVLMRFAEDLSLRPLTEDEFSEVAEDQDFMEYLARISKVARLARGLHSKRN